MGRHGAGLVARSAITAAAAAACPPARRRGSPLSQKLTFEQLRRGAALDLGECLQMEMRMVGAEICPLEKVF